MRILASIFGLLISVSAFGSTFSTAANVSCRASDCLKYGWIIEERGMRSDVFCRDRDCANEGWLFSNAMNRFSIECAGDGCFKDGWVQRVLPTGAIVEMTECYGGDCLKNGWESRRPGQFYETICMNDDCARNGWEIHSPGNPILKATCREGGCFTGGWSLQYR